MRKAQSNPRIANSLIDALGSSGSPSAHTVLAQMLVEKLARAAVSGDDAQAFFDVMLPPGGDSFEWSASRAAKVTGTSTSDVIVLAIIVPTSAPRMN